MSTQLNFVPRASVEAPFSMSARLVAIDEGPDILLNRPMVVVGRHPACDARLDSLRVSRHHCCMTLEDGVVIVRDLGSTNGIRINGLRVEIGRLNAGDELSIAHFRYRLEGPGTIASGRHRRSLTSRLSRGQLIRGSGPAIGLGLWAAEQGLTPSFVDGRPLAVPGGLKAAGTRLRTLLQGAKRLGRPRPRQSGSSAPHIPKRRRAAGNRSRALTKIRERQRILQARSVRCILRMERSRRGATAMIPGKSRPITRQLEELGTSGTLTGLSDAQLLGRFAATRAGTRRPSRRSSELIHRHGPMVLGVCRQILRHPHDADDAFQATFLVLVRKARSIRVGDSLAPWLYGVAYRTAQRARAIASRYRPGDVERWRSPWSLVRGHLPARRPALAARGAESPTRQVPGSDRALSPRGQDA